MPPGSLTSRQPGAKIRKIRKGTRSCWECKRRKNRCTWSTDEGKCDGCFHRGTRCIGQEFPEEHAPFQKRGTSGKSDESKIRRLEALVEELSRQVNSNSNSSRRDSSIPSPSNDRDDENDGPDISMSPDRRSYVAASSDTLVPDEAVDFDLYTSSNNNQSTVRLFGWSPPPRVSPNV